MCLTVTFKSEIKASFTFSHTPQHSKVNSCPCTSVLGFPNVFWVCVAGEVKNKNQALTFSSLVLFSQSYHISHWIVCSYSLRFKGFLLHLLAILFAGNEEVSMLPVGLASSITPSGHHICFLNHCSHHPIC